MWASLIAAAIAAWLHQLTGLIQGGELVEGHGTRGGKAMIATLRRVLIATPARLVRHGGQLIMRLAPGAHLLPGILAAIRALPAPAASQPQASTTRPPRRHQAPVPGTTAATAPHQRKAPHPRTRRDTRVITMPARRETHSKIIYLAVDNAPPLYSWIRGKRRDKPAWRRRWKSSTSKG